ncbi:helix-turn-helix domain-containing protein [uncultured Methanobrevibacter sp.]|uniref:helix-turn-helix domain-containing protein n=1 Tax=uncultured Methanobrevibacter sp. TaxID=253161 RepID=UPI0025F858A3|nr:helix-turn-helix domain-containing protein [uncultured Methanobrevibacter sp.]
MLEELSFVKASSYRKKVLKSLVEYPKTPTQIAYETKIHRNNISNTLKELKKYNIVECVNPEVRKGKLYRLTDKGKEIVSY